MMKIQCVIGGVSNKYILGWWQWFLSEIDQMLEEHCVYDSYLSRVIFLSVNTSHYFHKAISNMEPFSFCLLEHKDQNLLNNILAFPRFFELARFRWYESLFIFIYISDMFLLFTCDIIKGNMSKLCRKVRHFKSP